MNPLEVFATFIAHVTLGLIITVPFVWAGNRMVNYMETHGWPGSIFALVMTWWTITAIGSVLIIAWAVGGAP